MEESERLDLIRAKALELGTAQVKLIPAEEIAVENRVVLPALYDRCGRVPQNAGGIPLGAAAEVLLASQCRSRGVYQPAAHGICRRRLRGTKSRGSLEHPEPAGLLLID